MYLSQLILNPRSRRVQREIGNPYELHRTIMRAFPDNKAESPGRVLFRLEPPQITQPRQVLLVQSELAPDWTYLDQRRGYLVRADKPNPASKAFSPRFQPGQSFSFRLRANPTKRLFRDDPVRKLKKGQRIGLLDEADQRDWLDRKAKASGFVILGARIIDEGFSSGKTKENHHLKHFAVRFEGLLRVTNPDQFLKTLNSGIGSGKGLGFGLLSLARA